MKQHKTHSRQRRPCRFDVGAFRRTAAFVETMDCLPVSTVPEGPGWTYEIKLDGYRVETVKSKGKVTVFSRRRNVLNRKFGYIADCLEELQIRGAQDPLLRVRRAHIQRKVFDRAAARGAARDSRQNLAEK